MKRTVTIFLLAAIATLVTNEAHANVTWRNISLEAVLHEAQAQNRVVAIDFYADWCVPCQTMDALVWNSADITEQANRDYIMVRVVIDSPEGIALQSRFHITALPTVLALRPDGTEIDRLTGGADEQTVFAAMAGWRRGEGTLGVLEARLLEHPDDLATRLEVGSRYADHGDATHANANFNRLLSEDPQNMQGVAAVALLTQGERLFLRALHDPNSAVISLQTLIQRFPSSPAASKAVSPLSEALHQLHRDSEAIALIQHWLEASPADVASARANTVAWMMFRDHWDLPRAEAIARRGLVQGPRDYALIDTLAEIVYAQGRSSEAVQLEERAARLNPTNEHYSQQLGRFRTGTRQHGP